MASLGGAQHDEAADTGQSFGGTDRGGRPGALVRPWRGQAARAGDSAALSRLQDRADAAPDAPLGAMLGQAAGRRVAPAPRADGRGAVGPRLLESTHGDIIVDEAQDAASTVEQRDNEQAGERQARSG
jgi:hypothetical protein